MKPHLTVLSIVAALVCGCAAKHLTPLPAPAKILPAIEQPAYTPQEGYGRVLIDVVGHSAKVEHIVSRTTVTQTYPVTSNIGGVTRTTMHTRHLPGENRKLLCQTPCWVDLPYGTQELRLTASRERYDTIAITIGPESQAYRRALGLHRDKTTTRMAGGMACGLGAGSAGLGGLMFAVLNDPSLPHARAVSAGFGVVGTVAIVVGAYVLAKSRSVEQLGAERIWTLDPGALGSAD